MIPFDLIDILKTANFDFLNDELPQWKNNVKMICFI